jgi:hypothetical protein
MTVFWDVRHSIWKTMADVSEELTASIIWTITTQRNFPEDSHLDPSVIQRKSFNGRSTRLE